MLQQLSDSGCSSLIQLSLGLLPHVGLMKTLLNASPRLTSLCVEFQTAIWGLQFNLDHAGTAEPNTSGAVSTIQNVWLLLNVEQGGSFNALNFMHMWSSGSCFILNDT